MSGYEAPGKNVRFGDIFEAPHLFDVHLEPDAIQMGMVPLPAKYAEQFGKTAGVSLGEDPVPLYSPRLPQKQDQDFVLAHGSPQRAILLTDNCSISTAFGYDREGKPRLNTRLLFAAILDKPEDEIERIADVRPFNRFALPAGPFFTTGGVVDFRQLFMLRARHVDPATRKASLDHEIAEQLEVRFSAAALRHGPDATGRNAEKLAALLEKAGVETPSAEEAAARVADALSVAWRVEGGALEDAAEAADDELPAADPIRKLVEEFTALSEAAAEAAASLGERLVAISDSS